MARLTLEQRIAKLERILLESEDTVAEKGPEDYLKTLQKMIFKDKKLNPDGLSAEDHSEITDIFSVPTLIVDSAIGGWLDYIEPPKTLQNESLAEFKKIVGIFCKINKCLIDISVKDTRANEEEVHFGLKRWPSQPVKAKAPKPLSKKQQQIAALKAVASDFIKEFNASGSDTAGLMKGTASLDVMPPNVLGIDIPTIDLGTDEDIDEVRTCLSKLLDKFIDDHDYYTWEINDITPRGINIMIVTEDPDWLGQSSRRGDYKNPDDMWEDPDYQDMRRSAAWYSRNR